MKINDRLFGFLVKEIHELSGIGAVMHVMEHQKSGARLVYLDREEENKTFSIAFKTLPSDSTGVFHILEHSVLCGSEKYRLKDPFVELLSGSLNTFLNAMTFSDKTMYPVASTNEKEFLNLADVYLDAVFNPLAANDPNAFMQEGWHYEFDEEGRLTYKGVVLNEMRGCYSSPEAVADKHVSSMLFEGTCYCQDSGGDPAKITDLTFEGFKRAHSTYYHPSNSTVFLDGTMDIEKALALVATYLDKYDRLEMDESVFGFKSATRKKERREVEYEVSETEPLTDKTRLAVAHLTFRFDERKKIFGAAILSSALLSSNETEIKKTVLSSKLCEDVQVNIGEGIYENYFEIDFINIKDGKEEELESLFYETVAEVAKRGIDKEQLSASINSLEFSLRERDYGTLPLGVIYAMNLMETYLYSDYAVSGLTFEEEIAFLRDNIESGFFESLLREIFIENESRIALVMRPSHEIAEKQRREEEAKLSAVQSSLTEEQLSKIKEENERLLVWQSAEDSEEAKKTIPRLQVSDIPLEVTSIPSEKSETCGMTLLSNSVKTNKISYSELYFDVTDISKEEIFTSALIGLFLGSVSTENYSAKELYKLLKAEIGSLSAALKPTTTVSGETKVYFKVALSCLTSKKAKAKELLEEVLMRTTFDDKDAMENIVKQAYIASEESFASAGHRAAKSRVSAMLFSEAAVQEYYSGYEAHKKYKALVKSFDKDFEAIRESIKEFMKKYLVRERLTLSVTEDEPNADNGGFAGAVANIFTLGDSVVSTCKIAPFKKRNEGIKIPAKVAFSSLSSVSIPKRVSELGLALVASNLVSFEYLWGEIRVKGGAYGTGMSATRLGQIAMYSYRDPTPQRSIEKMMAAPDYLISVSNGERDMDKFIIGAIGDISPYLTPRAKAGVAALRYLNGITDEHRLRQREEILSANAEKLRDYAERAKVALENSVYCIVAPKDKLEEAKLDAILEL